MIRLDLNQLLTRRPDVTLNDIARAAHALGLELKFVTTPKPPRRKRAKKRAKR